MKDGGDARKSVCAVCFRSVCFFCPLFLPFRVKIRPWMKLQVVLFGMTKLFILTVYFMKRVAHVSHTESHTSLHNT